MSDDVNQLLDHARTLLGKGGAGAEGIWPRASALLTRQALEAALASYWSRRDLAQLAHATARSQFICLSVLEDPGVASPVIMAWVELSNACHLHAYELAPTASELLGWIEIAESFAAQSLPSTYEDAP